MTTGLTRAIEAAGGREAVCALADERRRETLRVLREADTPLSVTDLAVELTGVGEPSTDQAVERVRRRRVQLYHRHLPRLADVGLVEFDPERRIVSVEADVDATLLEDEQIA
jgi:predicted transcriptional regulator